MMMNKKRKRDRKINIPTFGSEIIIFITILISLKLPTLSYYFGSTFDTIENVMCYLFVFFFMIVMVARREHISLPCIITVSFFSLFIISSILNHKPIISAINRVISPLTIAVITEYYMKRKRKEYIQVIIFLFVFLMMIDLLTIIEYPNGMYSTNRFKLNWFLGYKSERVRAVTLPVVAFVAIHCISRKGKLSASFFACSTLALICTILSRATMGSVCVVLEIILITLFCCGKGEWRHNLFKRIFNYKFSLVLILVLYLMISITQSLFNNELFNYLLTEIFDKNTTASGRTIIWAKSIEQFLNHPIIGNGYISSQDYTLITRVHGGTQPHNLLLAILVYTGVFGLVIYLMGITKTFQRAEKSTTIACGICAIILICDLVFGITSMNLFGQFHYAMMINLWYYSKQKVHHKK